MLSFQTLYTRCRGYASDTQNDQFFKDTINLYAKTVEQELDNFVVEDLRTGSTIASFAQIPTPENYVRLKFLYVTSGSLRYDATPVYSEDVWQQLASVPQTSNYLQKVFPRVDYMELYPTPASVLTYTLQYVSASRDMQYDDYSAGSITSITNTVPLAALPFATVVGSGTAWTKTMAGQYFQFAGDKQWYKISSVTDATHIVLGKAYAGIPISGFTNTNYVIAEMPRIPEAIHMVLVYGAMKDYWEGLKKDASKAAYFGNLYDKWLGWGKATFSKRTEQGVIPSQRGLRRIGMRNPNLFPHDLS